MSYPKKESKRNKPSSPSAGLKRVRKAVCKQGLLAIATILLTVVMVFAMTTAWYTNVAQTNGLTFQTQQWSAGDVGIAVGETSFELYPGAEGVIPLTLTNKTDLITSVSVNIIRDDIPEEMQKRLFFYVDETSLNNGETVDRAYVSSGRWSYTYTLMPGQTIRMDNGSHNAAPLRWTWVYDMLGYYVVGSKQTDGSINVTEYIRPIEYDFEKATFDSDGILETVDGKDVALFLAELFSTDGYSSKSIELNSQSGYYPVEVDENGNGVWAYLCCYDQIIAGFEYDTDPTDISFSVELKFTTKNETTVQRQVSTVAQLNEALVANDVDIIQLEQDLVLDQSLTLQSGTRAILDLNGHSIDLEDIPVDMDGKKVAFKATDATLILMDGVLKGSGSDYEVAVQSMGAQVYLQRMTVTDVYRGVEIFDNLSTGDSTVQLVECNIFVSNIGLFIQGNGNASKGITRVIAENCSIEGSHSAVCGQGSSGSGSEYWGTDIQLINCKLNATLQGSSWAGIYHPQKNSNLTVVGGEIHGYTGVVVKGGTVSIENATIHAYGTANEPAAANSGWTDTGDGVYVEAVYPWKAMVELRGDDMKVISDHGQAVRLFEVSGAGPGSLSISGSGTYMNADVNMDITDFKVD